jgi:hypothetical protein
MKQPLKALKHSFYRSAPYPGDKNKLLKKLILQTVMILSGILLTYSASAQNIKIKGTVADEKGITIIGASVKVKNQTTATITDANGNFSIDASANAVLQISYVGSKALEIPVNNRTTINVSLTAETSDLNEVVVVGYGSVRKSDLTGSVTSMKSSELNQGQKTNVQQALIGRAAGVQIYQKSGEPGQH